MTKDPLEPIRLQAQNMAATFKAYYDAFIAVGFDSYQSTELTLKYAEVIYHTIIEQAQNKKGE